MYTETSLKGFGTILKQTQPDEIEKTETYFSSHTTLVIFRESPGCLQKIFPPSKKNKKWYLSIIASIDLLMVLVISIFGRGKANTAVSANNGPEDCLPSRPNTVDPLKIKNCPIRHVAGGP